MIRQHEQATLQVCFTKLVLSSLSYMIKRKIACNVTGFVSIVKRSYIF
jgi:hypothetical protein